MKPRVPGLDPANAPAPITPITSMDADARLHDGLAGAYRNAGVEPNAQQLATAVRATWQTNRLDPETTALQLQPQLNGQYGLQSPLASLRLEEDGKTYAIAAVTTAEDIERAAITSQARDPSAEIPHTQNIRPVAPSLAPSHKPAHEAGQHDAPHADSGQRTAELANQPHTASARQHVIGQHSEWAAEREETRQREHERELASARDVNKPDTQQYNPWDHTVAAIFVNRYMEAAEREDEAEMLKLAEAYAETPDYKELEAQGEEILRQAEQTLGHLRAYSTLQIARCGEHYCDDVNQKEKIEHKGKAHYRIRSKQPE